MIDDDDDLEAFIDGVEAALVRQFGPDHQAMFAAGKLISEFDWGRPVGSEVW